MIALDAGASAAYNNRGYNLMQLGKYNEAFADYEKAIEYYTGRTTELSTAGGTSDGRFIAPTGAQVLELGPVNATIHKVDENVKIADLEELTLIYENIMQRLLT